MKIVYKIFLVYLLFAGCSNQVNPLTYKKEVFKKSYIPKVCKNEYEFITPKIAVVNFTNNAIYGVKQNKKEKRYNLEGNLITSIISIFTKKSQKTINEKKEIDQKLSKSIIPIVESVLLETGGVEIYTRDDYSKINDELKFQDSGIVDEQSIVNFGRTKGVRYIITGSIDNVTLEFKSLVSDDSKIEEKENNKFIKYSTKFIKSVASIADKMIEKIVYTIKILDVESAKVIYSKQLEGETNLGKIKNPTLEEVIGGVKIIVKDTINEIYDDFLKIFPVKGYIVELRMDNDSNLIAKINLGKKQKIKSNMIFEIYSLEETIDPFNGKKSCNKIKLNSTLISTNQIDDSFTWTKVKRYDNEEIKLLQFIQKTSKKGGILSQINF